METLQVALPRGSCPIQTFGNLKDQKAPLILFFMDGFGPRQTLYTMGERLAGQGYRVLLPHLFYDHLPFEPFVPAKMFSNPDEFKRLMGMFGGLTQANIDADVRALLSYVGDNFGATGPIAATGYCMGGRYALTAAASSPRVVLAASFHGSNLALESDDSPHHRFKGLKSRIYVGVAAEDPTFGGAEEGRLVAALRDGAVDHVIEIYPGSQHGFVMPDLPVYNEAAAERHWSRLSEHLRETFSTAR